MAEDWLADVRKYDADADENIVAGIVRHCGIALRTRDASLVAFSDSKETDRVREGFCKKKLALTDDDATLDAAIASVGERMKADRTKNRVTVYYLLAQHFGLLGLFNKPKKATKKPAAKPAKKAAAKPAAKAAKKPATKVAKKAPSKKTAAAGAATAAAAAGTAPLAAMSTPAAAKPAAKAAPKAKAAQHPKAATNGAGTQDDDFDMIGFGCLALAVVLGAVGLAAFASGWLFGGWGDDEEVPAAPVAAVAPAVVPAPAAPAQAAPEGAGVIAAERDARPMLTVYFDTGAAEVTPDFQTASAGVVAYLEANPGTNLAISGYNDPSGNAELNAELSKSRAQNVQAALVAAGVDEARTDLVKPDDATTTDVTAEEARRVEVTIVDG